MADAVRSLVEFEVSLKGVKVYYNTVALDSDDSTALLKMPNYADKTVHVYGTFGAAGSLTIQGSNKPTEDGTTMATLHKTDLSALTFTSAGIFIILENPLWLRALVTGGDVTTALIMSLVMSNPSR